MSTKKIKNKRINLSLTETQYQEITSAAEELDISFSSYCVQAIEKSLGKVQKLEPKTLTIEPVEVYTADIQECLSKVGNTVSKLDRLMYTLSQKSSCTEYELQRLSDLINELRESEQNFNEHMGTIYEDRTKIRRDILKRVDKKIEKLTK